MADKNKYAAIGITGLSRFGGMIDEEWLRSLKGTKGVKVYKEMRDNDAIIGSFLMAIEMLIRQVEWRVEGENEELNEFLYDALFEDMDTSWQSTLSEILSMLVFGWAYLETVYKKRDDGKIGWAKWSIRAQETLSKWEIDDEGELEGMHQMASAGILFIPADKALLFRLYTHKNNPEGRSILRNAYRSWYLKKNIEEIEAIGIERDLMGYPLLRLPSEIVKGEGTVAAAALDDYKNILQNLRRDENEGMILPSDTDMQGKYIYDFTLISTSSRKQFDTNVIITRHEQRIAMTVLADFMLLGHGANGSFALSSSKTDLFALALRAVLKSIADVVNTFAIPRLLKLNGIKDTAYITHADLESADLAILGDFIQKLSSAGAQLFPDMELENSLRIAASLPEKTEEQEQALAPVSTPQEGLEKLLFPDDEEAQLIYKNACKEVLGEDKDVTNKKV